MLINIFYVLVAILLPVGLFYLYKYYKYGQLTKENKDKISTLKQRYGELQNAVSRNLSAKQDVADLKSELKSLVEYNSVVVDKSLFAKAEQEIEEAKNNQAQLKIKLQKVQKQAAPILAERKRLQDIQDAKDREARRLRAIEEAKEQKKRDEEEAIARKKRKQKEDEENERRRKRRREEEDEDSRRRSSSSYDSGWSSSSDSSSSSSWDSGGGSSGGGGSSDSW